MKKLLLAIVVGFALVPSVFAADAANMGRGLKTGQIQKKSQYSAGSTQCDLMRKSLPQDAGTSVGASSVSRSVSRSAR